MKNVPIKEIKRIIEATGWYSYADAMNAIQGGHNRFFGNSEQRIACEDENIAFHQKEIISKLWCVSISRDVDKKISNEIKGVGETGVVARRSGLSRIRAYLRLCLHCACVVSGAVAGQ